MADRQATQKELILAYLQGGSRLTQLEALDLFGCMRLAPRIEELRKEGLNIVTHTIERDGKRWAEYEYIPPKPIHPMPTIQTEMFARP